MKTSTGSSSRFLRYCPFFVLALFGIVFFAARPAKSDDRPVAGIRAVVAPVVADRLVAAVDHLEEARRLQAEEELVAQGPAGAATKHGSM